MPKFTNAPSLGIVYSEVLAAYPYGGLELTDLITDERQISVVWNIQTVKVNGVVTNVNTLNTDVQLYLRTLPADSYTVDSGPAKEIIPGWAGLVRVRNGTTYEYSPTYSVSSEEPLGIVRATEIDNADVVFQPGSRLTSEQLNTAVQQAFLSIQELFAFYQSEGSSPVAPPGEQGEIGPVGPTGDGFTGGSYDGGTGIVTFTSDDGLGFSTTDIRGLPTSVSLDHTRIQWTQDTVVVAADTSQDIFDSAAFPNAIVQPGTPLENDVNFTTSSASWGFEAPDAGTYQLTFSGSISKSGSIGSDLKAWGQFHVNGAADWASKLYNYDTVANTTLYPMSDTLTVTLSAGDRVSYVLGGATGSVDLSFRYAEMDITKLTFDGRVTGITGAAGLGWTGGSYDNGTGIVTFTSDDGLGFVTDDLRASANILDDPFSVAWDSRTGDAPSEHAIYQKFIGLKDETETLTNKTIDGGSNTVTNMGVSTLDADLGQIIGLANGMTLDSPRFVVTSSLGVVTGTLDIVAGGDMRTVFSDGIAVVDLTPAATVVLTAGTDSAPVQNFIYIPVDTKVLTNSTSGWPAGEYSAVATVICQSAASIELNGCYKVHAWTDHLSGSNETGHLAHVNEWIRNQPATWESGVELTPTVGAATFDIVTTAGSIIQLHAHTMPAFDTSTGSLLYAPNHPDTPYKACSNLTTSFVDKDANGTVLGGGSSDFYNLVIWGVVSEDAGDCQLFVNVPDGTYANNNASKAENDDDNTAVYNIPADYRGTGFLIARLCVEENAGTYSIVTQDSLLGLYPGTAAGAGSSGISLDTLQTVTAASTDFADFQARIAAL